MEGSFPENSVDRSQERRDRKLEAILMKYTEKINEGNNGVIFQIKVEELDDDARAFLLEEGIIVEGESRQVVKLLKLSEPGKLQREYRALKKARDVVHPAHMNDPVGFADIPAPTSFRELPISGELREWLARKDVRTDRDSVELMVMDRVEGVDIDTCILRHFLINSPRSRCRKADLVNVCDFNELEQHASVSLGFHFDFEKPRRQWASEDWRHYAQFREVLEADTAKLGFRIDARTIAAIENAMDLLYEKGGMLWGDGNLRNMMLGETTGVGQGRAGSLPKAWLIDFGSAVPVASLSDPEAQRAEAMRVIERLKRVFMEEHRPLRVAEGAKKPVTQTTFSGEQIAQFSDRLQQRFDQNPNPPFFMITLDINGMNGIWHDRLIVGLVDLVSKHPEYRESVRTSILSWFKDAAAQRYLQQSRVRSDLQRLQEWLSGV
jgi:hypothetical protein